MMTNYNDLITRLRSMDTADDWADKIRSRGSDKMNEKDTAE